MRFLYVVVVGLALVLLVGSGLGSATQICQRVEDGGDGKCPNGTFEQELAEGASFRAVSTDVVLTSPAMDITCARSSLRVRMTSPNSIKLLRGKITALSFSDCRTSGGTRCSTSLANMPYEAVLQNRDILFFDPDDIVISLNCGFLVNCELVGEEQLLAAEEDLLVASAERPAAKRGWCPPVPRIDASYRALPAFTFSS